MAAWLRGSLGSQARALAALFVLVLAACLLVLVGHLMDWPFGP